MSHRYLSLGVLLVVILSLILLIFSCSPLKPDTAKTPSPESGEEKPGSPSTEEPSTDLSYLISSNPAEVDNSKLPITPTEEIHITGSAPEVDIAHYRLTIYGLVNTEVALDYDTLLEYPTITKVVLLICPGFFADNAAWTGVPVTTLLAEAGVKPDASQVVFYALDGYQTHLSLEEIKGDNAFLAHTVNGEVLPREHGFPLRLVVTGEYGSEWVKWVERIEVK